MWIFQPINPLQHFHRQLPTDSYCAHQHHQFSLLCIPTQLVHANQDDNLSLHISHVEFLSLQIFPIHVPVSSYLKPIPSRFPSHGKRVCAFNSLFPSGFYIASCAPNKILACPTFTYSSASEVMATSL